MTKLQVIFLMITMIYLVAKVILGYIMYLITLQIEAAALERQRKMRAYLARVRERDRERYKEAYQWYRKRTGLEPAPLPVAELPQVNKKVKERSTPKTGTADKEVLQEVYQY